MFEAERKDALFMRVQKLPPHVSHHEPKKYTIRGNRTYIDAKEDLTYTQPYQKRINRLFELHIDLSLDRENITSEML